MKIYKRPEKEQWNTLIQRPLVDQGLLTDNVKSIIEDVKLNGNDAIRKYTHLYDGIELDRFEVSRSEHKAAIDRVPAELQAAIQMAFENISKFHKSQHSQEKIVETRPGVKCWRKSVAIERVGLYIPGGSAPLFSSVLMLGIPAQIAGCKEVILSTPPDENKGINPIILYAAQLVGITRIFKIGGAQAIAAMAYGTKSIPRVYKIFGPGNQYVTKAKELVQQAGVAIDMPAGPSEVLVIADNTCKPAYVAADLLSQAEHGADSQVILLSDNELVVENCLLEIKKQLEILPRKETVRQALESSKAIILDNMDDCMAFSNMYAPEHLIIASENAYDLVDHVSNAGSVFLGNYSCESAGDYASGTNHTLPTNGFSRSYSGVSLDSFVKKITYQELSKKGLESIGKSIAIMAEAEGLMAHKNAVILRLNETNDD